MYKKLWRCFYCLNWLFDFGKPTSQEMLSFMLLYGETHFVNSDWLSTAFYMIMIIIHIYFSASCEMLDKADAVLTSVKTKSVDSNLDFIEEEAEYDSKRSYEDL